MGHRSNPNLVFKFQVEYSVRKAPDETRVKARLIMLGEPLRMLLNTVYGTLDFPLQVSAEPRALVPIVRDCRAELRRSIGMKNERLLRN